MRLQSVLTRNGTSPCNRQALFHEILRLRKLAVVQVHVPLRGRDVGVARQSPGEFDSLLPADLRAAFVAGQIQHQIPRQAGQVPQPEIQ